MYQPYKTVARVVKTHGRNGEVVAVNAYGLSSMLDVGQNVALLPPSLKKDRFLTIDDISYSDAGFLIHFDGLNSIDAVEYLVCKSISLPLAELSISYLYRDPSFVLNKEVFDTKLGYVGQVVELMQGIQDTWRIQAKDEEFLIPIIEPFIQSITDTKIMLTLPEGISEQLDARR